ncbi:MAG TPA: hypothetical protein VMS93_00565 [Candidatus Saccharimonadales bacterium]|nr:hypothetical protein [Candidatus Saccharimonadales bacterium]
MLAPMCRRVLLVLAALAALAAACALSVPAARAAGEPGCRGAARASAGLAAPAQTALVASADTGLAAPVAASSPAPPPAPGRRFWLAPESEGGYLARDKLLHATISFDAAVGARAAGASPAASLLAAAALGVGKELHDCLLRDPGPAQGVSRRDLLADAAGVALAALLIHLCPR